MNQIQLKFNILHINQHTNAIIGIQSFHNLVRHTEILKLENQRAHPQNSNSNINQSPISDHYNPQKTTSPLRPSLTHLPIRPLITSETYSNSPTHICSHHHSYPKEELKSYVPFTPSPSQPIKKLSVPQLSDCLAEIISLEKAVEKARSRLAYTEDFNLMDAFRLFDFVGRGNVSEEELKEGLKILGVNT
jgi:hypothetical protein